MRSAAAGRAARVLDARLTALLLVTVMLAACTDMGDPVEPSEHDPPEPVSFSAAIQPIFNARCALSGCHVGPVGQGQLILTAGESYANIVDVRAYAFPGVRVSPGSPEGSVLYLLVQGGSMPADGSGRLPDAQIELIRTWIAEGALEN